MPGPAPTERGHIEPVVSQDRVHECQVCDVIFGVVFFDRPDAAIFSKVSYGLVAILIVFLPEDSFEFLAVIASAGFETLVTVKDIEDLEFHAGQATGHDPQFVMIYYIGECQQKRYCLNSTLHCNTI